MCGCQISGNYPKLWNTHIYTSKPPAGIGVKRNDHRPWRALGPDPLSGLRFASGTAGCPANPCLPPLPILTQPAVPSPGRPSGGGGGGQMGPNGHKVQKGAHFAFPEPKMRKSAHFRILIPKSLKSDAETIGFISICGQGAKRTPKCISGPKNAFWSPKCISGPKNAFGLQNAPRGKGAKVVTGFSAPL